MLLLRDDGSEIELDVSERLIDWCVTQVEVYGTVSGLTLAEATAVYLSREDFSGRTVVGSAENGRFTVSFK